MPVDRRWIVGALGGSLLLNLFMGGVLIGRVLTPEGAPGAGALAPAARVRLLSPAEHAAFAQAMRPHRAAIRQARVAQRAARATVEADIRAEPFDPARLTADLAALRQAQARQQAEVHAGLIDALGALTPASRAAVAARGLDRKPEAPASSITPAGEGEPAR